MNSPHRPALYLSLMLAIGVLIAKVFPLLPWAWVAGIVFIFTVLWLKRSLVLFYVLLMFIGALWMSMRTLLPVESIAFLSYDQVNHISAIEGIVSSAEDGTVDVKQMQVDEAWHKACGMVKLRVWGNRALNLVYGQQVRIIGKMFPIHDMRQGSFSYRKYLQERGIFWMFASSKEGVEVLGNNRGNYGMALAAKIRARINTIYETYLAPRESAFVAALVIGDRRNMPKDLKEIFVNTGTAHILAISGMNMAVIVTVFFFIFQLTSLQRRWKFIMTAVLLFAYAFVSGWSASVVRATVMSSVLLSSFAFEFEGDAFNSLGIAAFILLMLDPNNLCDVGFQLSFAAVAGILAFTRPIEDRLTFLPKLLALPIAVSIAAFLATTPIIAWHFRMMTPISILANIPIVPLADLVMGLGLALIAVSWCLPLAIAFATVLKAVLSLMILFALWFSKIPFGCWNF